MSQIVAVIAAKLRMGGHQVASVRHESKLKVSVITVAAFTLWVGAFLLFHAGFDYLQTFSEDASLNLNLGGLLMSRLLSILTFSLFFLLIFSNVLVSFSTLYRSREVVYLLQGPITYRDFFYARFFEIVMFSSWSLAFLGSPLMLAYGLSIEAGPVFYLAAILFYVPYVVVPASIGCAITILLVRVFPRLNMLTMSLLSAVAVTVLFLIIARTYRDDEVVGEDLIAGFGQFAMRTQSPYLPSHWTAEGILTAAGNSPSESVFWFLLLTSTALVLMLGAGALAERLFFPGWSYLMGQDRQRFRLPGRGILGRIDAWLSPVRQPYRGLLVKDIILFWRDPTQWSQFVIFFGIMAVYTANLRNTSRSFEQEVWRGWIACLNVGAVTLILSTLTSRFVFPLVSLEGRRFWILGLAPLTFRQLVWQKFWLSVASTSAFTVSLAVLSAFVLQLEPHYYFLTVYSVVLTNFGLAGCAVGLGTLYPTFTEDNPARIVSGMGGTLNLLVSIGYITVVVALQTVVMQWRVLGLYSSPAAFNTAYAVCVLLIGVLTLILVFVPMRLGLRNLDNMEF